MRIPFTLLVLTLSLMSYADFDSDSCAKNPQAKAKAERIAAAAKEAYKVMGVFQQSNVLVGDVNSSENCTSRWINEVITGGRLNRGDPPQCGIILNTSKETATALARASQIIFPGTESELSVMV